MSTLVLLRHGRSLWNANGRFTGWTDVPLAPAGREEARRAASLLRAGGYSFDIAFSSTLQRAAETLRIVLEELGLSAVPVIRDWRLNERHYGALQGMKKSEVAARYGEEAVLRWRRAYDARPPLLAEPDTGRCGAAATAVRGESLADVTTRLLPLWREAIEPALERGSRVLVIGHGSTVRALSKHLEGLTEAQMLTLHVPTGIPLVYVLDHRLQPSRRGYLGDPKTVRDAIDAVAAEGKAE